VDLRIPKWRYSLTTSNLWLLIDYVKLGGRLDPNTRTFDFCGLRRYFHLVAYWDTMSIMAWSSWGEDAMRARSSAYIGAPQYTLPILTPSPNCSRVTSKSLTNRLYSKRERIAPCFTPCLMQKVRDCSPSHNTAHAEDSYHFLRIRQE